MLIVITLLLFFFFFPLTTHQCSFYCTQSGRHSSLDMLSVLFLNNAFLVYIYPKDILKKTHIKLKNKNYFTLLNYNYSMSSLKCKTHTQKTPTHYRTTQ